MFYVLGLTVAMLARIDYATAVSFFINDGETFASIDPIRGTHTAEQYYGWHTFYENEILHGAGNPLFGPEARTGYIWLYENTETGELQLGIRLGNPGGGTGYYSFEFFGVPDGVETLVADEGFGYVQPGRTPGPGWADFAWVNGGADGLVAGGFAGFERLVIDIVAQPHHPSFLDRYEEFYSLGIHGIDNWYFLSGSGDPLNPSLIALNFDDAHALTITSEVPEPTSMVLLAAGLLGAGLRRRRTCKIAVR